MGAAPEGGLGFVSLGCYVGCWRSRPWQPRLGSIQWVSANMDFSPAYSPLPSRIVLSPPPRPTKRSGVSATPCDLSHARAISMSIPLPGLPSSRTPAPTSARKTVISATPRHPRFPASARPLRVGDLRSCLTGSAAAPQGRCSNFKHHRLPQSDLAASDGAHASMRLMNHCSTRLQTSSLPAWSSTP